MKNRKLILSALLLGGVFFSSCDDDQCKETHYESFVTVDKEGDELIFKTDKGNTLNPTNLSGSSSLKEDDRGVVLFHILDKKPENQPKESGEYKYIHIEAYQPLLAKPIWKLTEANRDSSVVAHKDPVIVRDAWIGGGYLNLYFSFLSSSYGSVHYVNVVENTLENAVNPEEGVYKVEFIHNGNNDYYGNWVNGIACFRLPENIDEEAKEIHLKYFRHRDEEVNIKIALENETNESSRLKNIKPEDCSSVR
ncbi:MAG: NigD-like C-terminal domain-containing protein [Bacteroidales bacterium]